MKFKATGSYSLTGPAGMFSPAPDEIVEVDDGNTEWVEFLRQLAAGGLGDILEDAPETKTAIADPGTTPTPKKAAVTAPKAASRTGRGQ